MTTADKFASEWAPILSRSHRNVPVEDVPTAFTKFATIPPDQTVNDRDNERLLRTITEAEVLEAIKQLSRHKAAGQDGLNNDFYKATTALMVPALVTVCNQILSGEPMPQSFLEALIIPLRKKGDSDDAMDYRQISLLQTSYKIFAKVLAARKQTLLPRVISDSQQGCVHGRRMQKTVMMMMAQLSTATTEAELAAELSRCILLLDFQKAYDTVDREFLYEVLRRFEFDERFIALVRRMHTGTQASFLVNGLMSEAIPVRSGIRQGCPLAPLPFLLVVEILGLALKQDPALQGLDVPGHDDQGHHFSAFVDDSTVFLEKANQIPRALSIVRHFGSLSGLHVQPAKSKLIFLNKAISLKHYEGIEVVSPTRRRAIVFELPRWAEVEIHNLYNQFLWAHATTTEKSRHKANPGLLVTPRKAEGIGLVAISVAIKTQGLKHAIDWLTQRPDKYFAAWGTWAYRGLRDTAGSRVSPAQALVRAPAQTRRSPGQQLQQELGEWMAPTEDQVDQVFQRVQEPFGARYELVGAE